MSNPSVASDPAIQVSDVIYQYQPEMDPALRGVSLTIHPGEFVAMIGQNGAGKTTLAKHFNGLFAPTSGTVKVAGMDTKGATIRQLAERVGYCYQNPDHQIFLSTLEKEVAYGPSNLGLTPQEVAERVEHGLRLVGLWEKRGEYPFLLGHGERQKLAVASILALGSQILVVDEPTTGLDLRGIRSIMALLRQWNREDGRTIVIITHDIHIVAEYVPRTIVMAQGRVVADGPTREVLTNREALELAHVKPPQITRVAQRLSHLGIPPDVMTVDEMLRAIFGALGRTEAAAGEGE